jgi:hypothetical protein
LSTPSHIASFALPQLFVDDLGSPDALLPSDIESNVEIWRDHDETICAYGYQGRGAYWLEFPGLAKYRFTDVGDVIAFAHASARQNWIDDTYFRSVLPLVLQVRGFEVLHASAVITGQGVVAFCATSESGKSTIAYGLGERGYPIWSDDAVALGPITGVVRTLPLPFRVRLRPTSAAYFGPSQTIQDRLGRVDGINHSPHDQPAPLAALWTLKQGSPASNSEPLTVRQLEPTQAFAAILTHAYCFSLQDRERKRQMLQSYLALVSKVPVFELCFQSGIERLPAILDCIEEMVVNPLSAKVKQGLPNIAGDEYFRAKS